MEKGKISSLQMAIMLYPTIVATAILGAPSITAKYALNDLWLSPILAALIGYATVYIAYKLHKLYPKQTVIQFSEQIIGRIPGKILGFLYLFFISLSRGNPKRLRRLYCRLFYGQYPDYRDHGIDGNPLCTYRTRRYRGVRESCRIVFTCFYLSNLYLNHPTECRS